jgi:hypothetical protein
LCNDLVAELNDQLAKFDADPDVGAMVAHHNL